MLSSIASVTSFARNNPRLTTVAGVALGAVALKLFARYSLAQVYHVQPATTLFDIRDNIRIIEERNQSLLTTNLIYRLVSLVERLLLINTQDQIQMTHQQTARRVLFGLDGYGVQIGTIKNGDETWVVKARPYFREGTLRGAGQGNTIITLLNAQGKRMGDVCIAHCYRENGNSVDLSQSEVQDPSKVSDHYLIVGGIYNNKNDLSDVFTLRARIQIIMEIFYRSKLSHLRVYITNDSEDSKAAGFRNLLLAAAGFRDVGTHDIKDVSINEILDTTPDCSYLPYPPMNEIMFRITNWGDQIFPRKIVPNCNLEMRRETEPELNSKTNFFTLDSDKKTREEVTVKYEENRPWEEVIAENPILSGGNTPVLPEYLS